MCRRRPAPLHVRVEVGSKSRGRIPEVCLKKMRCAWHVRVCMFPSLLLQQHNGWYAMERHYGCVHVKNRRRASYKFKKLNSSASLPGLGGTSRFRNYQGKLLAALCFL